MYDSILGCSKSANQIDQKQELERKEMETYGWFKKGNPSTLIEIEADPSGDILVKVKGISMKPVYPKVRE